MYMYIYIYNYVFVCKARGVISSNRNPHGTSTQASGQRASEMPMQRSMLGKFFGENVAESRGESY